MSEEENKEETTEEAVAPEETPAEVPEEAPVEETPAEPTPAEPAADAGDEAVVEPTHPKQIRKRARSLHSGEARPPRTPEERAAERTEQRKKKATTRRAYRTKVRAKRAAEPKSAPAAPSAVAEREAGKQKIRQGLVVSDKADKTITVRVDLARRHPAYQKIIRSSTTLHAHDEKNDAHTGDTVRVVESRPLSRTKRWRLVDVVDRAK